MYLGFDYLRFTLELIPKIIIAIVIITTGYIIYLGRKEKRIGVEK